MIYIQQLSKSVPEKILFDNISFKIGEHQKVGLVGPNGSGKTTLLNILLGNEQPDTGKVVVQQERIGYIPQKIKASPNQDVGSYLRKHISEDWEEYKLDEVLAKVSMKEVSKKTIISKLSGGQKMKVALAGVLLSEPTTLLFDEPTNNLDEEAINWLENFLDNFDGKLLLVSHDRYFLDACVNKIIEIDPYSHRIFEFGGNYSDYKKQKATLVEHQEADYERQQKKELHMKDWITEKQQQLKYHPSTKVARQLQAMKTRLDREITNNLVTKPKEYTAFKMTNLGDHLHQKKVVISLHDFDIFQLISIPELFLFGQDRINLKGRNGSGKSTLLKSIVGQSQYYLGQIQIGPNVKLGYFSQEHESLDQNKSVLAFFIEQTVMMDEAKARWVLGKFLFTKQKVFFQIKGLSEGEKARLSIAILLYQDINFLILDEPTNHLDLESREVLAEALLEYSGGFVVVSHDRYFLQQINIQRILRIENRLLIDNNV